MKQTTKQAAKGKWDAIISQLVGEQAISRKHCACPVCGGEDRYRYDNKRNDGDWFCNVCGVGDGFRLLTEALAISFAEAAAEVDKIVGNIEAEPFKPDIDIDRRRQSLNALWQTGNKPGIVSAYLQIRKIPNDIISEVKDLRGTESCYHKEYGKHYPAMLALIRNNKGVPISIHRTYFITGQDGSAALKEKKIMPPVEKITGGAVRLGEPDETLILAEGIETALAGWAITGHPAWATISAHGLANFTSIPRHVKRVIVCADNDTSFTGQAAAFECAKYMKQRAKVETEVIMPSVMGFDMQDALVGVCGENKHQATMMEWKP